MNAQKFTQRSLEAIQEAQSLAIRGQQMQIEPHICCWLCCNSAGLSRSFSASWGYLLTG